MELMGITKKTDVSKICQPKGCDQCNNIGYRGRTGIYELIMIDEPLRGMIHKNESLQSIETYIRPHTPSIRQDGFKRVLAGDTSLAEILRVTTE
jgi:general secretion pathway protein E